MGFLLEEDSFGAVDDTRMIGSKIWRSAFWQR